jgi:hypothetical protein
MPTAVASGTASRSVVDRARVPLPASSDRAPLAKSAKETTEGASNRLHRPIQRS